MQTPPTEVLETVRSLIQRASRLMRMAKELSEEYAINVAELQKEADRDVNGHVKTAKAKLIGSRLDQLRKYLDANGPQTSKEIKGGSGMPTGTIATLLTAHGERDADGRWTLKK